MSDLRSPRVLITHPSQRERNDGARSGVELLALTANGARTRRIALTENELLKLIEDGARFLRILRDVNGEQAQGEKP